MLLAGLDKYRDVGLLVLRLGVGAVFVAFGWGKLMGGPELWAMLGGAMGNFGITFAPTFWGFLAACAEFGGGLCLALGFLLRPAMVPMVFTMIVAAAFHLSKGDGLQGAAPAIVDAILFASLILIGPGAYSVDGWWARRRAAANG